MTVTAQPAPQVFSTAFGLLMAAAAAVPFRDPAFFASALAVVAVLAGIQFRAAATLAVLLSVCAVVLGDSLPVFAALSGLSAAAYLVLRHAAGEPRGAVTVTTPTVIGAAAFAFAGLVATAFPLRLPWLPLLAPLAVFGIYMVATRPFLRDRRR
jgi:hypothetical protein